MKTNLSLAPFTKIGKSLKGRGDFFFLTALFLALIGGAAIFYRMAYLPIYAPKPLSLREPVFNTGLYERVIANLESRQATLEKELADIPRDPLGRSTE